MSSCKKKEGGKGTTQNYVLLQDSKFVKVIHGGKNHEIFAFGIVTFSTPNPSSKP